MNILLNVINNGIYIISGYINWLVDIISGKTKYVAKQRLEICNKCEYNNKGICKICGCILKAKVRASFPLDAEGKSIDGCPEKKW